ncbi:type II secretion system protein GspM [Xylophilus ampelinus]|uniref:General secretion pathway protein M n=1 Tax=Xylophilus ampelinus TaxID=54067 RepID=A0A318SEI0_9BURK|nr:type II secretion system protein GspM [Xylophilus ampelinus]MCS4511020.1 type II secretion system protein M [Xylophilus ampelinus]PYE75986.1 general secretion pathway protein M [Xylophilus ampelinus]
MNASPRSTPAAPLTLRARWNALAARERSMVRLAAAAVGIALVWWVALAPALRTLQVAETRRNTLDAQQQRLLALQAEARRLKAQPKAGYDESLRALEASVRDGLAGTGRLSVVGERATVTLRGTPPEVLAAWLARARANAHALPIEGKLMRSAPPAAPVGNAAAARPPAPDFSQNAPAAVVTAPPDRGPRWDGTLVLALPAR